MVSLMHGPVTIGDISTGVNLIGSCIVLQSWAVQIEVS